MNRILCACGCGTELNSEDAYGRARSYVNGHNGRKFTGIDASRWAVQKRWAKRNPGKIRDNKKRFYRSRKIKALALLGNSCFSCSIEYTGNNAPIFEFHHPDPTKKEIGVTRLFTNKTWDTVLLELSKCVILCANCHNLHHGGRW